MWEKEKGKKDKGTKRRKREREQYLIVLYNTLCCVPGSNCFLSSKAEFSVVRAPGISQPWCQLILSCLIYVTWSKPLQELKLYTVKFLEILRNNNLVTFRCTKMASTPVFLKNSHPSLGRKEKQSQSGLLGTNTHPQSEQRGKTWVGTWQVC